MAVICCATPSELYLEETRSTLQFASRAKLVKTRAQVNEVLDDRSIIKRLQRELAEARRQVENGGFQPDQVRALEHRAATAGTAAKEARERLMRLQASILNHGGVLLGTKSSQKQTTHQSMILKRKRRLSEGSLLFDSPTKPADCNNIPHPETVPKPSKQPRAEAMIRLSSDAELALFKAALYAKAELVQATQSEAERQVMDAKREKDKQIEIVEGTTQELELERDRCLEKIALLTQEIAQMRTTFELALYEKSTQLEKVTQLLEQELLDRKMLEENIDSLQIEKAFVEKKVAQLEDDCNELECINNEYTMKNEKQTIACEELISSLERKKHLGQFSLIRAGFERDTLKKQCDKLEQERDSAIEQSLTNEDAITNVKKEMSEVTQQRDIAFQEAAEQRQQCQLLIQDKEKSRVEISTLKFENDQLKEKCAEVNKMLADIQSQNENMELRNIETNKLVESQENELNCCHSQLENIETQYNKLSGKYLALQAALCAKTKKLITCSKTRGHSKCLWSKQIVKLMVYQKDYGCWNKMLARIIRRTTTFNRKSDIYRRN